MLRRFAGVIGAAAVLGLTWILPAILATWEEWTGDLMGPMLLLFGAGGATHLVAWSLTEEHRAHVRVTTAAHILVGIWLYVMTVSLTGLEGPAGWLAVVLAPSALALLWWTSRGPERPDLRTVDGQVVFRFSKRKLLFVLASLLIGEVSAVVWLSAIGTGAISDPTPQLAGVRLLLPPVVVAITMMVAWVASRILNPVALAIDAEGIIDRTSLLGYGRLTWEVVTLSSVDPRHVALAVKRPDLLIDELPTWRWHLRRRLVDGEHVTLSISLRMLIGSQHDVARTIREWEPTSASRSRQRRKSMMRGRRAG